MAEGTGRRVTMVLRDALAARDAVARMEGRVDAFENQLKAFLGVVRRVAQAELASTEQSRGLSAELLQFVKAVGSDSRSDEVGAESKSGEPVFEPAMQRFGEALSAVNDLREQAAQNMEMLFAGPLQAFLNTEFRELKELKRVFERACEDYEAAVSRAASIANRMEARKEAAIAEMQRSKLALNCAAFDYLCKMEGIDAKRNFEFLERMCSYMVSQTACFHGGYDGLSELGPLIRSLTTSLGDVRAGFAKSQAHTAEHRAQLEATVPFDASIGDPDARVPLQGYLMKRSSSVRKDWKRRWFFVANREVQYTRSWRDSAVLGRIPLLTATVKFAPPKPKELDRENCFEVISPSRRFMLQAPSAKIMEQWVQLATAAISENLLAGSMELQDAAREREERSRVEVMSRPQVVMRPAASNSVAGTEDERARGESGGDSAASRTVYSQIVEFDQANSRCADCGAPRPAWVSINNGVVLCIQCAGIHRSLGVRISKVRSMTLDALEPEVMEIFRQLGNGAVNGMLEYSLSGPGLQPSTPAAQKERFIKQKYLEMAFVEPRVLNVAQDVRELFEAVASNDILTVASLLVHGIGLVTARDEQGHTPLHIAVSKNYAAMTEFLFLNDAPLNAVNATRETALHLAAEVNAGEAAAVLMRHTAVRSLRNSEGKTAFELACERGFAEMAVEVIRDKGQEESLQWVESATPESRPCKVKIDFQNLKPRRAPPDVPSEQRRARSPADGPAAALARAGGATAVRPPLPSKHVRGTIPPAVYPSLASGSPPAHASTGVLAVEVASSLPSSSAPPLPPRSPAVSAGNPGARSMAPPPLPQRKWSSAGQDANPRAKPPIRAKASPLSPPVDGPLAPAAKPLPAVPPKPVLPPKPSHEPVLPVGPVEELTLVLPDVGPSLAPPSVSVPPAVSVPLPGAVSRRSGGRGRDGSRGALAPPALRHMHQRSKSSDNVFAMLAAMADDVRERDGVGAPVPPKPLPGPPSPTSPSSPRGLPFQHGRKRSSSVTDADSGIPSSRPASVRVGPPPMLSGPPSRPPPVPTGLPIRARLS